ncbi:mediator of RNA polymerase II transcription subunit 9-like isoform X1 [Neltuma alba]|uniref:mediator of RNA polymerase II transcription subunit 9-like isoform X1 n=1 Tax=Neltuma alba TaxID=207710 RepID=UPI0010A37966|nr:mediator of RNA polymerase II transcription subunit 9-like isoform X1 [Prosopis alba]
MDYSGGNWTMIPTHSSNLTQSNQDPLFLHQQQHQFLQQQQQQTFQAQTPQSPFQQPQQNLYQQQHQPQRLLQQHQQQPLLQQQPQPQPQPQQNPHQSLASHFHLLHLMENLAEVVEHGNRDQQSDALINELSSHFERCQQLLDSISGSISTKAMTVEGQKKKLEESEQLLNQRRDLIANYRKSVEELVKSEP